MSKTKNANKSCFIKKIRKNGLPLTCALYLGVCFNVFSAEHIPTFEITVNTPERAKLSVWKADKIDKVELDDVVVRDLGYFPYHIPICGLEHMVYPHRQGDISDEVNLGTSRRKIAFTYEGRNYETFFGDTQLNKGHWERAREGGREAARLILTVKDRESVTHGDIRINLFPIVAADHIGAVPELFVGDDNVRPGYYDGTEAGFYSVHQRAIPGGGVAEQRVRVIRTHKNRDIVYVQPFNIPGQRQAAALVDYVGNYLFVDQLRDRGQPHMNNNPIIYVEHKARADGTVSQAIYNTKVTHEKWGRDHWEVGFSIISKNDREKIQANNGVNIADVGLEEGAYQLESVKQLTKPGGREYLERWKKLNSLEPDDATYVDIYTPNGVTAFPGLIAHNFTFDSKAVAVDVIQNRYQEVRETEDGRRLEVQLADQRGRNIIALVADSGAGKTVIAHALARRELIIRRRADYSREVIAPDPLPGARFGTGDRNAGTLCPIFFPLADRAASIADLTGLRDPRGPIDEIVNFINIRKVVESAGRLRLVLVQEARDIENQGQNFFEYITRLTEMFPVETLEHSLLLLATKMDGDLLREPADFLRARTGAFFRNPGGETSAAVVNILRYFHEGEGSNRLMGFRDIMNGGYDVGADSTALWNVLERAHGVPQPMIIRPHKAVSDRIGYFAENLTENIIYFLNEQFYLDVIRKCENMITAHIINNLPVAQLREEFKRKKEFLEGIQGRIAELPGNQDLLRDVGLFGDMDIDLAPLVRDIRALNFLRENIQGDLDFKIVKWGNALTRSVQGIEKFIAAPQVKNEADSSVTMEGIVGGMSDINVLLTERPALKKIKINLANTVFIDEDLTARGVSLKVIAPRWHVMGDKTINLSGTTGGNGANGVGPGANGAPGQPGTNAGHFYGKGHEFSRLDHVTFDTRGGQGGNGGNGVNGATGTSGAEGTEAILRSFGATETRSERISLHGNESLRCGYIAANLGGVGEEDVGRWASHVIHLEGIEVQYEFRKDGTAGGKGGHGGAKGPNGHSGELRIDGGEGYQIERTARVATDGTHGAGGGGGKNGNIAKGTYICGVKSRQSNLEGAYSHNGHPRAMIGTPKWSSIGVENRGHLPNGATPTTLIGAEVAQIQSDFDTAIEDFKIFNQEKATNPITSHVIRVFPGLI